MTCSHSGKACVNKHLCEWCPVPNAYGFFLEFDKHNRAVWKQKFILEKDREAIVACIDAQISKLEAQKAAILEIPGVNA